MPQLFVTLTHPSGANNPFPVDTQRSFTVNGNSDVELPGVVTVQYDGGCDCGQQHHGLSRPRCHHDSHFQKLDGRRPSG